MHLSHIEGFHVSTHFLSHFYENVVPTLTECIIVFTSIF